MHTLRIKHRVTTALAVVMLVGAGAPAATSNAAADTVAPPGTTTAAASRPSLPKGKVVSQLPLSIRERPSSVSGYLGSFAPGTIITLSCKATGQNVDGNNIWYLLGGGKPGWVAARYVRNLSAVAYCRR